MTNAEKYKTAEERAEAFSDYHKSHYAEFHDLPFDEGTFAKVNAIAATVFEWLEREVPTEEPLPCPFCGGVVSIHESNRGLSYLECLNGFCNYKSGEKENEDAAIAAHNRVAVAERNAAQAEVDRLRDALVDEILACERLRDALKEGAE